MVLNSPCSVPSFGLGRGCGKAERPPDGAAAHIPQRLLETRAKIAPFVPIFISKRRRSSIPTTCQALRRALRDFSSLDTKGASRGRESLPSQMRTRGSERSGDLPEVTQLASGKAGLTQSLCPPLLPCAAAPRHATSVLKTSV